MSTPVNSSTNSYKYLQHLNSQRDSKQGRELSLVADTLIQIGTNIALLNVEQSSLSKERICLEQEVQKMRSVHVEEWAQVIAKIRSCMFCIVDTMRIASDRLVRTQIIYQRSVRERTCTAEQFGRYQFSKNYLRMWCDWSTNLSRISFTNVENYPEHTFENKKKIQPVLRMSLLPNNPLIVEMAQSHWNKYLALEEETARMRAENDALRDYKMQATAHHKAKIKGLKRMVITNQYDAILKGLEIYESKVKSHEIILLNHFSNSDAFKGYVEESRAVLELLLPLAKVINRFKEEFSK